MLLGLLLAANLYWSDADSGRFEGEAFRLHGVDAPETYRPKCEAERAAGFAAKEWMLEFTKDKRILIVERYGKDQSGRSVVDLTANGVDVAEAGVAAGVLAGWDYDGDDEKPDWCGYPIS